MSVSFKHRLTGLLKLFSHGRAPDAAESQHAVAPDHKMPAIGHRIRELYGEEKLQQQLLYERWAVKDTWHLRTEALPLLLGLDPDKYTMNDDSLVEEEAIKGLWRHAGQCIEHGLLQVTNRAQAAEDWRVEPLVIYQWAVISRLSVPDPLVAIMDFVGRTVKRSPPPAPHAETPDGGRISASFDEDREKVLGMALAVLAAFPDRCRNAAGEIRAELMAGVCKEQFRVQGHQPQLADGAMIDLINKWLKQGVRKPEARGQNT